MLGGKPVKIDNGNKLFPDPPDMADVDPPDMGDVDPLDDDDLDVMMVQGWQCDDDGKAEWCLAQMRDAQSVISIMEAHYKEQMEKIRTREQRRIDVMITYLRRYLVMLRSKGVAHATKSADTYKLPSGTLEIRHGTWEYQRDEDAMVEWLRRADMDDYVKVVTKTTPAWGELKKLTTTQEDGSVVIKETGEVVEGVRAVLKPDTFSVK